MVVQLVQMVERTECLDTQKRKRSKRQHVEYQFLPGASTTALAAFLASLLSFFSLSCSGILFLFFFSFVDVSPVSGVGEGVATTAVTSLGGACEGGATLPGIRMGIP